MLILNLLSNEVIIEAVGFAFQLTAFFAEGARLIMMKTLVSVPSLEFLCHLRAVPQVGSCPWEVQCKFGTRNNTDYHQHIKHWHRMIHTLHKVCVV